MKKYYLGLFILALFVLGLAGYTITQGGKGKKDEETTKKFQTIANKLDGHTIGNNKIPESLDELKIKDVPDTIKYEKISDEKYKICVSYDQASNEFDAGWFGLLTGVGGSAPSPYEKEVSPDEELSSIDYGLIYLHKKGETCQTVKPPIYGKYFPTDLPTRPDPQAPGDADPNQTLESQI